MNYSKFIEECEKLLQGFPNKRLIIPTLGGKSIFLFYIENAKVKIVNSEASPYVFSEQDYNSIRERFIQRDDFTKFKTCNYTVVENGGCEGWRYKNGNNNEIFYGYLPAVFRELFARNGISVCNELSYINAGIKEYICADWNEFELNPKEDIFNSSFLEFVDKHRTLYVANDLEKSINDFKAHFISFSGHELICEFWSFGLDIAKNLFGSVLGGLITDYLKDKIKECYKQYLKKQGCKFPRRNCKKCLYNKKR